MLLVLKCHDAVVSLVDGLNDYLVMMYLPLYHCALKFYIVMMIYIIYPLFLLSISKSTKTCEKGFHIDQST